MIELDNAVTYINNVGERLIRYADFVPTSGLLNGKMGIVLFLFTCSRITGEEKYDVYANNLLDEVLEKVSIADTMDFDTGLCGLSYGVEYLVQNGFVAPDSMDALSELDDHIANMDNYLDAKQMVSLALYWKHRNKAENYRSISTKVAEDIYQSINAKEFCTEEETAVVVELLLGHVLDKSIEEEKARRLFSLYAKRTSQLPHLSSSWLDLFLAETIAGGFSSDKTPLSCKTAIRLRDLISLQRLHIRWGLQIPDDVLIKVEKIMGEGNLLKEFISISNPHTMNLSGNMLGFAWILAEEIINNYIVVV